jgi:Predicted transcriptional regulators
MDVMQQTAEQLTSIFAALADPTRRAILQRLTIGDANVAELAEPFAMSQPAVSRHLKVLEGAGLISRTRVATAHFSHLEAKPLREAVEYMEKYRRFWNSSFDRLDAALAAYQAGPDAGTTGIRNSAPHTNPHTTTTHTNAHTDPNDNPHQRRQGDEQ